MFLSCDLTTKNIGQDMRKMLEVMYTVFQRDGFDYFYDMIPALHNYITVDNKAFLSTPYFMLCMYSMAKTMLEGDPGEDPECHAAKLVKVNISYRTNYRIIPFLVTNVINYVIFENTMAIM